MPEDIDLNWCSRCGGRLELVDGTDPDVACENGQWEETYTCRVCDGTGTYHYNQHSGSEHGTGVVA